MLVAVAPALDGALAADHAQPPLDHLRPFEGRGASALCAPCGMGRAQGLTGDHCLIAVGAEVEGFVLHPPLSFRFRHAFTRTGGAFRVKYFSQQEWGRLLKPFLYWKYFSLFHFKLKILLLFLYFFSRV